MEKYVQAFICNFTFDSTIEDLMITVDDDHFLVDDVLQYSENEWTVPKWAKKDDIVMFMFAKTAIQKIVRIRAEYNKNKNIYTNEEQQKIEYGINHGLELYKKYGGKIFAIGRVDGEPFYERFIAENQHWKGRIYASILDVFTLQNPIDISEFNSFILVSRQSSITGIFGSDYERLKQIIISKNTCSKYLTNSKSTPLPLKEINDNNWLELSNMYRRQFFLEKQFRTFYVDYFLKNISDDGKIYMECRCKKDNCNDTFIDNVIKFNKKYLCIEVKLNKDSEKDIIEQLEQYCNCNSIELNCKMNNIDFYNEELLLIDTEALYYYKVGNKSIIKIVALDNIQSISELKKLKEKLNRIII